MKDEERSGGKDEREEAGEEGKEWKRKITL